MFSCVVKVVRAAEEAASTLASSIHPEQCIKVLCPIIQTADYPIDLAAIKMQTKVIERIPEESLYQLLPDIIPGLLQVCTHLYMQKLTCLLCVHTDIHSGTYTHTQDSTFINTHNPYLGHSDVKPCSYSNKFFFF